MSTTQAQQILERAAASRDEALLPAEVFNDAGIHALELERIFTRCWVFIGLEQEVANPGDYRLRRIGEDPFILLRGDDGEIRVLFNGCRHRGSTICRTDSGTASHFRCPYHAWTYDNTGRLKAVPARHTAYRELDLDEWSLLRAPKVASYHGLVFACLDADAPSIEDYLGRFRWYLDAQVNLTPGGMELLGEPHRWIVRANWKSGSENFTGDSSHTHMVHKSILRLGMIEDTDAGPVGGAFAVHVNNCDGHQVSMRLLGPDEDAWCGYPPEVQDAIKQGPLSPGQIDMVRRTRVSDGTIFPNLSFIHFPAKSDFSDKPAGYLSLRVWQPKGPAAMEIWSWILVPREASEEYKKRAYQAAMSTFSPSGHFEQDDSEVWSGIVKSAGSVFVRTRGVRFNYQMGMPGMSDGIKPMSDWPGPGDAWPSNAGESGLRSFHGRWLEQMTAAG